MRRHQVPVLEMEMASSCSGKMWTVFASAWFERTEDSQNKELVVYERTAGLFRSALSLLGCGGVQSSCMYSDPTTAGSDPTQGATCMYS